jgi:chlorite dismutase
LLVFTVVSATADLGFMLLMRDLHAANEVEIKLKLALGDCVLAPLFSFLSITEKMEEMDGTYGSKATPSWELPIAPIATIARPDVKHMEEELEKVRMEKEAAIKAMDFGKAAALRDREAQAREKLEPLLSPWLEQCGWPVFCFYPISNAAGRQKWYALDSEAQEKLEAEHASVWFEYKDKLLY